MNPQYEDPFDNNASKAQLRTDKIFSFLYLIRSHIPSNQIFYLIFFFLKYNIVYLATNNINGKEDNIFTVYKVLNAITIFGNGYCSLVKSYSYLCLALFIFMIAFIIATAIVFNKFIKKDVGRTFAVFLAYVIMAFSLFSQYFCELLVPGILSYSLSSSKTSASSNNCKETFLNYIVNDEGLPRYILTIMNVISLFLINGLLYSFLLFMNAPTRSFTHGNLNFNYNKVFTPAFAIYSFQGFITCADLYGDKAKVYIRLAFCITTTVLCLIMALSRIREFNFYALNLPLKYTVLALYIGVIGGVIETGLYFIYTGDQLSSLYYYLKIAVILINAFLLTYYFLVNLNIYFTNQLIGKIFIEKNKMTPGDLAMYDLLLYNYLNDKCDFSELYHILHTHKVKCTVPRCPCKTLEIDRWINKDAITEDNEHYLIVKLTQKREDFKNMSMKDFIEIAEYEIRKKIMVFRKEKKGSNFRQDLLILLHLDIIYLLKRDNCIAMYFCDKYRAMSKQVNIITRYYMYEYKILISRALASIDKISSIDRELNEKREMTKQMKEFYRYAEFMEKVKKMIINCIFALETILKYKRKQSMKNLAIVNLISCDQFLRISEEIQQTNRLLTRSLREYLKTKEPDNPELCILVCYYFLMLNQKAPKKMVRKLEDMLRKSKENGEGSNDEDDDNNNYISQLAYDNINISNPMIVILNTDDNFIIIHITMKMCSILKEGKREILKNDLHNYLPKDIVKMHKILMKQFLLTSNAQFIKDTFIMDKYSNLIPMKVICNPLNTLETNFGLVINFIETPTTTLYNDYYFFLNSEFHFLAINELFAKEYFFNLQMMKIIHLDFCTFFGIKAEKLNLRLRNFFAKNKLVNKNEIIEECNKQMSVYTVSKMEHLFSADKMGFLGRKGKPLKVKEKIHKKDIINNLTQLQKNINDFGLDMEWYKRIGYFRDRLLIGINNDTINDKDIGKEQSFLCFFEAYYTINSIGNFYYIIVNLRETINNTEEKNRLVPLLKEASLLNSIDPGKTPEPNTSNNPSNKIKELDFKKNDLLSENSQSLFLKEKNKSFIDKSSADGSMVKMLNDSMDNSAFNKFSKQVQSMDSSNKKNKDQKNMNKLLTDKKGTKQKKDKNSNNKTNNNNNENENEDSLPPETRKLFEGKKVYSIMDKIWKFFIACEIFFCFLWVIFNQSDFKTAFDLYYINLYSTNIQTDIFYGSLSLLAKCGIYGQLNDSQMQDETDKLEVIAEELRSHSKLFITYLNYQIKKKELMSVFEILNEQIDFNTLLTNKESNNRTGSFYDEISYYQHKIYQLAYYGDFSHCSYNDFLTEKSSNEAMKEIYYIIYNVPSLICTKFNDVNVEAHEIFEDYLNGSKKNSIAYILTSIVLAVILMIIMQLIMSDHKANTQILLNTIYTPHQSDYLFEEDLYNYKELLFNFTKESYIHFRSMHTKILCNEASSDTKRNIDIDNIEDNSNNISGNKKSDKVIYKFSDNSTIPKHYFITMLGMYFAVIVFIILEIIHLIYLTSFYEDFSKSNSISLNFVELIPKVMEILIYTRISILIDDYKMIKVEESEYQAKSVYQYYDFSGLEDVKNILSKFGNSEFSYLYFQYNQMRKNINQFVNEKQNLLERTKLWESYMQEEGSSFCIYSSLGYLYSYDVSVEALGIFKNLNEMVISCKEFNGGFNLNSLDTILDVTIYKIENLYSDYVLNYKNNTNLTSSYFLQDKEMYVIENNIKQQLKYVYDTYVNCTRQDIDKLVTRTRLIEIIFSIALFVSASGYALIVFLLLRFLNNNISVLVYIKAFMEQALDSKGN